MTKAETGEFLFDDLRELAASHTQQKLEFEKLIPDSICLGLFVVSGMFPLCYLVHHCVPKYKVCLYTNMKIQILLHFRPECYVCNERLLY